MYGLGKWRSCRLLFVLVRRRSFVLVSFFILFRFVAFWVSVFVMTYEGYGGRGVGAGGRSIV